MISMGTMSGRLFDLLTEERKQHSLVAAEDLDDRGLVQRLRVQDQSVFDAMFVHEHISRSQYEGSTLFLSDLERSGVFPSSVDVRKAAHTPSHKVGDATSVRWMAFSSAYRFACESGGYDSANALMRIIPQTYSWGMTLGIPMLSAVALRVRGALGSLAVFYGCEELEDPRDIIRSRKNK